MGERRPLRDLGMLRLLATEVHLPTPFPLHRSKHAAPCQKALRFWRLFLLYSMFHPLLLRTLLLPMCLALLLLPLLQILFSYCSLSCYSLCCCSLSCCSLSLSSCCACPDRCAYSSCCPYGDPKRGGGFGCGPSKGATCFLLESSQCSAGDCEDGYSETSPKAPNPTPRIVPFVGMWIAGFDLEHGNFEDFKAQVAEWKNHPAAMDSCLPHTADFIVFPIR